MFLTDHDRQSAKANYIGKTSIMFLGVTSGFRGRGEARRITRILERRKEERLYNKGKKERGREAEYRGQRALSAEEK
jgi:ribosomal protein S18 acetylase RimI-like enzyme